MADINAKNCCELNIIKNSDKKNNPAAESKLCNDEMDNWDYDKLLPYAGELGRYQILMVFATLPFYVNGLFVDFNQLFMTEAPSHWCWIPELGNLSQDERVALAIPPDVNAKHGHSMCEAYAANWTDVLYGNKNSGSEFVVSSCDHGWEFNTSEIPYTTTSTEMEWVCDKGSYQAIAQSVFFCGSVLGSLIFGVTADAYGRIVVIVASNLIGFIGGVASSFAQNFTQFAICRFIAGMSYDNCMMMTNLLLLEYLAAKQRTLLSNLSFGVFYGIAAVALPWIALACNHWRVLGLVTSVPMALAVFAPCIFLESPRWLLAKGRVDDAINKIIIMSKINRRTIPPRILEQFKLSQESKSEEKGSLMDLMRRPKLRWIFLNMCIVFLCESLTFDALARIGGDLNIDFFVSFSLQALTECPSMLLIAFIMDRSGRRLLCSLAMLLAAIACIVGIFGFGGWTTMACVVIGRFCSNVAYTASIQWTAEILPTTVRGVGNGVVHIFGALGTVISPYVIYLESIRSWGPFVIVALTVALGSFLALLLPETTHEDMPHTFEESENLVDKQKMWSLPCWPEIYIEKKTCDTYL